MPSGRGLSTPSRVLLCVQAAAHCITLMFSLMVMIPMSIHQEHFRGHCILFSTGVWREQDGQFQVDWASQAYCNFAIFVTVIAFLTSLGSFVRALSYIRKNVDASLFGAFCQVIADALMAVFTLIAALFITLGFKTWCSQMTERFAYCKDAAGNAIDKADDIDTSQFYFHLTLCQAGIWTTFVMFFLALSASLVRLRRFNDRESFRASMAKERKRLLNEDLIADVPVTHDEDDESIDGNLAHEEDGAGGGGGGGGGDDDGDDDEIKVKEDQRSKKKKRRLGAGLVKSLRRSNKSKDKDGDGSSDAEAGEQDKNADVREESVGDDHDKIAKIAEEVDRDNKDAKS